MEKYIRELQFDLPIQYKSIKIYPVTMRDYLYFFGYFTCLDLDKNSMGKKEIIKMTELEYIYYATLSKMEETPYLFWFDRLLEMVLKDEESFKNLEESIKRYKYDDNKNPYFEINGQNFYEADFQKIKVIIALQNSMELTDKTISKEVRDSLEKAKKYRQKLSGSKSGTIEDYIVSLAVATGWSYEYIYNLSIRKFMKSIQRLDNLIHYKIYLSASMSGMVEFKDKSFIKHWLTNLEEKDKYEDVSMDVDAVQNKLKVGNAKT